MGFLDKIRQMFSQTPGESKDEGLYYYVRLDISGEVVRVRIAPGQELNPDYDAGGYISRKTIIGPRSYRRAEATFRFDEGRNLVGAEISGGSLSTYEDWKIEQAS